ncbi:hypothetical protein LV476_08915 [Guyparkeria hydrothermalis]|uniref:cell division protein ZipA C-terminal FtsZ-binding domain-containing protein n=1 Tax=Guyparkeria hydrothermalis TaxID=923 RepID=UPI0020210915|nr:cell division protein ZipA C-terminal FtsZ-binding domain-containing protein [Guyparkeria hydrothermalis]MCL7745057.1 hypothetical protein [Guyparkeria hydrothermalis]
MEWLRWIVLLVGLLVIGGIVWMYRRHRSEQAVDLGGGRTDPGGYHDPIDASVGARVEDERGDEARREPQLEAGEGWSPPDADGFIDGASAGRVVWRADDADDEPAAAPAAEATDSPEPAVEPEPEHAETKATTEKVATEKVAEDRPRPGFSSLFTRQGQQPSQSSPSEPKQPEPQVAAEAEPAVDDGPRLDDEKAESAESAPNGAVISMMIVDRDQSPIPAGRVRRAIEESGFQFGEFSIYHFHGLDGEEWFSLMNAVSPGHFDPEELASYETPALALFMQLPVRGGADPSLVFERMHQVASTLAESLDAMLIDDRREPLDTESVDRYRELIDLHG